jgi:hypothetical protein
MKGLNSRDLNNILKLVLKEHALHFVEKSEK